jgi:hypothetical protein
MEEMDRDLSKLRKQLATAKQEMEKKQGGLWGLVTGN